MLINWTQNLGDGVLKPSRLTGRPRVLRFPDPSFRPNSRWLAAISVCPSQLCASPALGSSVRFNGCNDQSCYAIAWPPRMMKSKTTFQKNMDDIVDRQPPRARHYFSKDWENGELILVPGGDDARLLACVWLCCSFLWQG